jgi:c(7)-type cytochrome triheme protein
MIRTRIVLAVLFCLMLPFAAAAQILVGGGSIRFEPKGAAPVLFSHEKHVAANDRKCSGCHFGVFQMEKGSHKMNMSRITKGHFCGTCHNGRNAFDVEDKAQCTRCHR